MQGKRNGHTGRMSKTESCSPVKQVPNLGEFHQVVKLHNVDFDSYAFGYKVAADLLAEALVHGVPHKEQVIFPVVFLYRQYIELRLKTIILNASSFLGKCANIKGHNLESLWNRCRELMGVMNHSERLKDIFKNIANITSALETIDSGSIAFRYPEQVDGSPTMKLPDLHMDGFFKTMKKLSEDLELVRDFIDEQICRAESGGLPDENQNNLTPIDLDEEKIHLI